MRIFGTKVGLPKAKIQAQQGAGSFNEWVSLSDGSSVFTALLSLLLAAFAQAQHTLSSQGSQILSTHRRRPADVEQLLSFASSKPKHWRNATAAFSYDGRCLALAGHDEALVISSTGRTLWKWNYCKINRFVGQDR